MAVHVLDDLIWINTFLLFIHRTCMLLSSLTIIICNLFKWDNYRKIVKSSHYGVIYMNLNIYSGTCKP